MHAATRSSTPRRSSRTSTRTGRSFANRSGSREAILAARNRGGDLIAAGRACGNSVEGFQRTHDVVVGRTHTVVGFYEPPPHHAGRVDHVGSRVRPTSTLRIEDAVAVDDAVPLVFQQREGSAGSVFGCRCSSVEILEQVARLFVRIDADG